MLSGHELKICVATRGLVEHLHVIQQDCLPINPVGLQQIYLSLLETLGCLTQLEHLVLCIFFEENFIVALKVFQDIELHSFSVGDESFLLLMLWL